jgi:hypothetical protein
MFQLVNPHAADSHEDAEDVAWLKKARKKPMHYRPLADVLAELER